MCQFLRENPIVWDVNKSDYTRVSKKLNYGKSKLFIVWSFRKDGSNMQRMERRLIRPPDL